MVSWKRNITSGLITLGPLLVLTYVIYRFYGLLVGVTPEILLDPDLLRLLLPGDSSQVDEVRERVAQFLRVVISLTLFFTLTLSVGYLMRTTLGQIVEQAVDNLANRLPGLRIVYNASKIAVKTTLGDENSLQTPVRVETWENHRMNAFKTGKQTDDGRDILFLPTAPNFTSGFIVEVEPDRVSETDESIEEALTRIVSAGFGNANGDQQMGAPAPDAALDKEVSKEDTGDT